MEIQLQIRAPGKEQQNKQKELTSGTSMEKLETTWV